MSEITTADLLGYDDLFENTEFGDVIGYYKALTKSFEDVFGDAVSYTGEMKKMQVVRRDLPYRGLISLGKCKRPTLTSFEDNLSNHFNTCEMLNRLEYKPMEEVPLSKFKMGYSKNKIHEVSKKYFNNYIGEIVDKSIHRRIK